MQEVQYTQRKSKDKPNAGALVLKTAGKPVVKLSAALQSALYLRPRDGAPGRGVRRRRGRRTSEGRSRPDERRRSRWPAPRAFGRGG
jgi:hypothetical protein